MGNCWRAVTDAGRKLDAELMYLTEPDSWEKLEEDLDKCVAEGTACTYFSKDGTCKRAATERPGSATTTVCLELVSMTFTSEERREMAENLRHLTIGHSIQYKEQFFDELAEVVVGFEDYHDFDVVLDKLADLIDPEGGDDD